TIIGVMPASFANPTPDGPPPELWAPLGYRPSDLQRRQEFLSVVARLKPGVPLDRARQEMNAISERLEQQYPATNSGWGATVIPLHERFVGNNRAAMLVLMSAVSFLLLIACANVANLLLARSLSRHREVALRAALGASIRRLARQFLTESAILVLIGGGVGTSLAPLAIRFLRVFGP